MQGSQYGQLHFMGRSWGGESFERDVRLVFKSFHIWFDEHSEAIALSDKVEKLFFLGYERILRTHLADEATAPVSEGSRIGISGAAGDEDEYCGLKCVELCSLGHSLITEPAEHSCKTV